MDLPKVKNNRGDGFVLEGAEIVSLSSVEGYNLVLSSIYTNTTILTSTILVSGLFAFCALFKKNDLLGSNRLATYLFESLLAG